MCVAAQHKGEMQRPGGLAHVVNEAAEATQKTIIFAAQDRLAN